VAHHGVIVIFRRPPPFGEIALGRARRDILFTVAVAVAYTFTFSQMLARLGIPGKLAMMLGACSLAYFILATAALAMYSVGRIARKQLGADVDPGRRRALNTAGSVLMAGPFVMLGYGALVGRTDFRVREVDVPLPGLPNDLDGLRLLQLSDIHLSAFLSEASWHASSMPPSNCGPTWPWSRAT